MLPENLMSPFPISLVVFDLDDTLLHGLDGGYVCGVDYADAGRSDYTFTRLDALHLRRNDGQRFELYPEVPALFDALRRRGVLISLASYNHPEPVWRALQALDLLDYFQHPVVEWSGRKDLMLQRILAALAAQGYTIHPANALFVDDDLSGHYRQQMAEIGVHFLQRWVDLHHLDELLRLPQFEWLAPV